MLGLATFTSGYSDLDLKVDLPLTPTDKISRTTVLGPRTHSLAQVFWTLDDQTQRNQDHALLQSRRASQVGAREVLTHRLSAQDTLEGGVSLVRRSPHLQEYGLWNRSLVKPTHCLHIERAQCSCRTGRQLLWPSR